MFPNHDILRWLKRGETLTPLDALEHFGGVRLSARIYELREQGWPIECERRMTCGGNVVGHYTLVKNKDQWPGH